MHNLVRICIYEDILGTNDMWSQNLLTERLNLDWPILQAPMGRLVTPVLAAAVSNAGGLGGLGMLGLSAEDAERRIAGFRQQSGGSVNVSYPLWDNPGDISAKGMAMRAKVQALYDDKGLGAIPTPEPSASNIDPGHLDVLQRTKPEVISFHFGLPAPNIMQTLKASGIFIISSATTVAEARALEDQGADAVIAQGTEAGGHRGTFTGVDISMQPGLFALLPQVVDAVSVPVIAAGGVSDGRTVAAAFMLGASAVQLGTAFLRCEEAAVPDVHRAALGGGEDANTIVTELISGLPARYIKNELIDELSKSDDDALPFPAQLELVYPLTSTGDHNVSALFSGQSASLTKERTATDLVQSLAAETNQRLKAFHGNN